MSNGNWEGMKPEGQTTRLFPWAGMFLSVFWRWHRGGQTFDNVKEFWTSEAPGSWM